MRNNKPTVMSIVGPLILAAGLLVGIAFDETAAGPLGAIAGFFLFGAIFNAVRRTQYEEKDAQPRGAYGIPLSPQADALRRDLCRFDALTSADRESAVLRFLELPPEEQGAVILDLPEHQKQLFSNALSPWLQKGKS